MPFWAEGGWLPDVNVWIVTQMAFLRLLTNRKVMGEDVQSPFEALTVYADFRADERVRFTAEPDDLEKTWLLLMNVPTASGNAWTDAYLVAFAQEAHLRLPTFDAGMRRWSSMAIQILKP